MDLAAFRERIYASYRTGKALTGVSRGAAPYLARVVARHFPADRGVRVLDLGCGDGGLIEAAVAAGYRAVRGVDVSPEQVASARQRGVEGRVAHGDLLRTLEALPDASEDVVVCFDVLEHLDRPALIPLAEQVARALRPGGRWLIHVPNASSPFFGRIRYGDLTHELAFTGESLRQLASVAGFARLDVFEDTPVVHGLASLARTAVWQVIRAGLRVYLAAETGVTDSRVALTQTLLAVAVKA